jgi:hypothetical protein
MGGLGLSMTMRSVSLLALLAYAGLAFVSLAISFCGMTLGALVAETAYVLVYGNEGDAEFSALVFKGLVGLVLFLGMPVAFYLVRTAELVLDAEFSRIVRYGSTIALLMIAVLLLAGSRFDYQWVIFSSTTAVVWLVYSESIEWIWVAPRRTFAAMATASVAVGSAVLIPHAFHALDVHPDWFRHAAAAAILLVALITAIAALVLADRRRGRSLAW